MFGGGKSGHVRLPTNVSHEGRSSGSSGPKINELEMLVKKDTITELVPLMGDVMLEELENLQKSVSAMADLLRKTIIGVQNSYNLALEMSFLGFSNVDYVEIIAITERLDRCKEILKKLPLADLQAFARLDRNLEISVERVVPLPSTYQVLHECRRALTVKADCDGPLLQLLSQFNRNHQQA